MSKGTDKTKDGRTAKKDLYYYMNRAKKRGTSKPGKGTVTDKALKDSAKTANKKMMGGEKEKMMYKKGGKSEFGMLSVKAGYDNNPNATAADRIVGAKKGQKVGSLGTFLSIPHRRYGGFSSQEHKKSA